jgi:hypothetical protein
MFGNQTLFCQVVLPVRSCAAAIRQDRERAWRARSAGRFMQTWEQLFPARLERQTQYAGLKLGMNPQDSGRIGRPESWN